MENPYLRTMAALARRQELLEEATRARLAARAQDAPTRRPAPRAALVAALIALAGRLAPAMAVGDQPSAIGLSSQG